jgi:hypothetical protein
MKVAYVVQDLPCNQRIQFAEFIKVTCKISSDNKSGVVVDGVTCNTEFMKSSLPKTFNFIDNTYIRGKYDILENIPCPVMHNVEGHVYVFILDVISHPLNFSNSYTAVLVRVE